MNWRNWRSSRGGPPRKAVLAVALGGLALVAVVVRMAGGIGTSREEAVSEAAASPARVSVENGEIVVIVDRATQGRSGIVTAALEALPRQAEVLGYGAALAIDSLAGLREACAAAEAEAERTGAALAASRAAYGRTKALYDDAGIMSASAVEAAEATFRSDRANVDAAAARERALAARVLQNWGPVLGDWITRGSGALDRLLAGRDVLVQVTLPPGKFVSEPPRTARLRADGASRGEARLVSRAARTDPRIQGLSFYYVAPAQPGLIPGMNVAAYLPVGEADTAVVVPRSAVVWAEGGAWVYVQTGAETFVRRAAPTDEPTAEGGYVLRGEPGGSRVVVRGAQLLLSEEYRSQIRVGEDGEKNDEGQR